MPFLSKTSIPPIFVVTLAETPWKKVKCIKHFQQIGLDPMPVFIEGFHGPSINLRPVVPYSYNEQGVSLFMHSTAVGCVLTHKMALSVASGSGASEFIICEDDTLLCPDFIKKFKNFRSDVPDDRDVCQLEYAADSKSETSSLTTYCSEVFPYPFWSGCIWWKRSAAKQAVSLIHPVDKPFDIILIERIFPQLKHCVANPQLARNGSVDGSWPSTIGPVDNINSSEDSK